MKSGVIFVFLLILIFGSCRRDPLATLPSFTIRLSDSISLFNTGNIPKGKTLAFLHFDADCKECQNETDSILKNMHALKEVQFYFLTSHEFEQVRIFNRYYKLGNYPNITVAQDYDKSFAKHFKSRHTPLMALYNKDHKLQVVYEGLADMPGFIAKVDSIK